MPSGTVVGTGGAVGRGCGVQRRSGVRTEAPGARVDIPAAAEQAALERFESQAPAAGTRVAVEFDSRTDVVMVDAQGVGHQMATLGSQRARHEVSLLALDSGMPTWARIVLQSRNRRSGARMVLRHEWKIEPLEQALRPEPGPERDHGAALNVGIRTTGERSLARSPESSAQAGANRR